MLVLVLVLMLIITFQKVQELEQEISTLTQSLNENKKHVEEKVEHITRLEGEISAREEKIASLLVDVEDAEVARDAADEAKADLEAVSKVQEAYKEKVCTRG